MAVFPSIPGLRLGSAPTLESILRGGGQPTVIPQDAPMPVGTQPGGPAVAPMQAPPPGHVVSPADAVPPGQEEPDIVVSNEPFPKSRYRSGIVQGGTFRTGGLGGNILGALGDAFLVQSGNRPQYAPRLMQARVSEAMENFGTDPERAAAMLMQIDPEAATKLYEQIHQNTRLDNEDRRQDTELEQTGGVRAAQVRQANLQTNEVVNDRALAMLGGATAQTYPAIRQRVLAYYKANNMEPPFDLPETFDEAGVQALRMSRVPVGTQIELDDNREYRRGMVQNGRTTAGARVVQANRPPASATRPATPQTVIGGIMAKQARGETLTADEAETLRQYRAPRPRAGGSGPNVRAVRGANGSYTFVQQ